MLVLSSILMIATVAYGFSGKKHKEVAHTDEREVKISMEAGFGDVYISKTSSGNVFDATVASDKSFSMDDCVDYSVHDGIGYLHFTTDEEGNKQHHTSKSSFSFSGIESTDWWLNITRDVPVSLDLELGLGKADLNMTGLSIKDFTLSTGASSVFLRFDEPNKSTIEDLSIEAGLSKFQGYGLCNANFNNFKFSGGLGTYTLDFSGKLNHEVDVNIDIGLGSVTIIVPRNIGVKVYCEKNWISHLSIDDEFRERDDDTYYSPNYNNASGKMNMHVEAGMGSVKIRRE